jgi:hypothetical protein
MALMEKNKEQTTLQTLINGLIARKKNIIKNADSMPKHMLEGGVMGFDSAIDLAQLLLEMEKGRIIKAYNEDLHGGLSGHRKFNDGEDYYNKTYGDGK